MAVIKRQIPGTIRVWDALSTKFLPTIPIIPVGMVETITNNANFLYDVLIIFLYSGFFLVVFHLM